VFGTDVSLQKARTVAFFSNPVAAQQLLDDLDAEVPHSSSARATSSAIRTR
jgi:hypothetical protein